MSEAEGQAVAGQSHAVDRRCAMVRESGERCRGIPALGETFCHAHRRYRDAARSTIVTVPLMEDEATVAFVRSQTVRAIATGAIPPANGRAMLEGCRDAERRLDKKLEVQKVALRYAAVAEKVGLGNLRRYLAAFAEDQRVGSQESVVSGQETAVVRSQDVSSRETVVIHQMPAADRQRPEMSDRTSASRGPAAKEEEDCGGVITPGVEGPSWAELMRRRKEREAASGEQRAERRAQGAESGERTGEPTPPTAGDPGGAATGLVEEEPQTALHQSVFPGVKEQWERAQQRLEVQIAEMVSPREGENWHEATERREAREAAIAAAV